MSSRTRVIVGPVALLLVGTAAGLRALMPAGAEVRGRVIDARTKRPIAGARVVAWRREPAVTDAQGAFAIAHLASGRYTFQAQADGYRSRAYPAPVPTFRSSGLIVRAGDRIDEVTFELLPDAMISGRVVGEDGKPVARAAVQLRQVSEHDGVRRVGNSTQTSANEFGEFRFQPPPGSYELMASMEHGTRASEPVPISVDGGRSRTGVELRLVPQLVTSIAGRVTHADGTPAARAGLRVGARGARMFDDWHWIVTDDDGRFHAMLPRDEYRIEANVAPPAGTTTPDPRRAMRPEYERGVASVTVGKEPITDIAIVTRRGGLISGRVIFDGRSPRPVPQVSIRPPFGPLPDRQADCFIRDSNTWRDRTFTVWNAWGQCRATADPLAGPWRVKAVRHHGADLLDKPIDFSATPVLRDVEVVYTDRHPTLLVDVVDDRGARADPFVVIAFRADLDHSGKSRDPWRSPNVWLTVRTFLSPSLRDEFDLRDANASRARSGMPHELANGFDGLLPGDYYVVALDDSLHRAAVENGPYLAGLIPLATRVTLGEDNTQTVRLQRHAPPRFQPVY